MYKDENGVKDLPRVAPGLPRHYDDWRAFERSFDYGSAGGHSAYASQLAMPLVSGTALMRQRLPPSVGSAPACSHGR